MVNFNSNIGLGMVHCSLYTLCFTLKEQYCKGGNKFFPNTPVELIFEETLATIFIIPARQSQFIRENNFHETPCSLVVLGMNTNSEFTGSNIDTLFWYLQSHFRQTNLLRGGRLMVDFDAAEKCREYVKTMEGLNFRGDNLSIFDDGF